MLVGDAVFIPSFRGQPVGGVHLWSMEINSHVVMGLTGIIHPFECTQRGLGVGVDANG